VPLIFPPKRLATYLNGIAIANFDDIFGVKVADEQFDVAIRERGFLKIVFRADRLFKGRQFRALGIRVSSIQHWRCPLVCRWPKTSAT
jgi:hypothetical protein